MAFFVTVTDVWLLCTYYIITTIASNLRVYRLVNYLVHNIQHTYTGQYLCLSVVEYSHLNLVRQKRKNEKKNLKGQSARAY